MKVKETMGGMLVLLQWCCGFLQLMLVENRIILESPVVYLRNCI